MDVMYQSACAEEIECPAGLPVTAETCSHYLVFASEEVPPGATQYKCAPPLRGGQNRQKLLQALSSGVLDGVASDHSPAPPELKLLESGDFLGAWGGISGSFLSASDLRCGSTFHLPSSRRCLVM